jgi:Helix-turn-helix domain
MKTPILDDSFDLRRLPPTLTVPAAGAILGVGRTLAYEAARRGDIPSIRIGNRVVVPTRSLLAMLGISGEPIGASE